MLQDQPGLGYDSLCSQLKIAGGRNPRCKYCDLAVHSDTARRQVLTCRSEDFKDWYETIDGFEFDAIVGLPTPDRLPCRFIPQINTGLAPKPLLPCYSVSSNIGFITRRLVSGRPLGDIKASLGLPHLSPLILMMFGKDRHVEEDLWNHWSNVIASIQQSNVSLVVAPDYSLLWDEPRMEHLLNMKRSLLAFSQLQKAGIPAIPHLFWYRTVDVERQADWFSRNPSVKLAAVNLQDCTKREEKALYFSGLTRLRERLDDQVHYLIAGLQSARDLQRLSNILGSFYLTNYQPYMCAYWRVRLQLNGTRVAKERAPNSAPRDLFEPNHLVYEGLMARLIR